MQVAVHCAALGLQAQPGSARGPQDHRVREATGFLPAPLGAAHRARMSWQSAARHGARVEDQGVRDVLTEQGLEADCVLLGLKIMERDELIIIYMCATLRDGFTRLSFFKAQTWFPTLFISNMIFLQALTDSSAPKRTAAL